MANLGNIAKREDRTLTVGPFDTVPSGASGHTYAIGFRAAKSGADLVTITFGAAEYQSATATWQVLVPSASSTSLSVGIAYVGVWRTGSGTKKLLNDEDDYVMVLDRPGNA